MAAVRVLLLAPLLALVGAACVRQPQRPNVLLITVDTLRADHLSCYGHPGQTTPRIDALAAESVRFDGATTPRAKTTPAIASLLSGLYPHDHGVRDLSAPLAPHVPLLQERLRAAGWRTGAIVGNYVLKDERAGLRRGFDLWVESLPDVLGVPPHAAPQRTARSLTDAALVALGLAEPPAREASGAPFEPREAFVRGGRPWMLWLHYMDPHGAYEPPEQHRRPAPTPDVQPFQGRGAGGRQRVVADYNVPPAARIDAERFDAAAVRALYEGEVRYVDAQIGRLLDALRRSGALEDTLVVLTADHGESLGEHEYFFEHGRYAYEATCRVPLLVRLPRWMPGSGAPGVRGAPVSLVDLAPTLLELCELAPLGGRSAAAASPGPAGASLARTLLRADGQGQPVFYEKVDRAERSGAVQTKGARIGRWKLLRRYTRKVDLQRPGERELVPLSEELYDLASDPLEERDLSAAPPQDAPLEELRRQLLAFTAADEDLAELDLILQRRREALERGDREALEVLQALGY